MVGVDIGGDREQKRGAERLGRGTATPTGQASPMRDTPVMDVHDFPSATRVVSEGKEREKSCERRVWTRRKTAITNRGQNIRVRSGYLR
jgi:hypothetical protein